MKLFNFYLLANLLMQSFATHAADNVGADGIKIAHFKMTSLEHKLRDACLRDGKWLSEASLNSGEGYKLYQGFIAGCASGHAMLYNPSVVKIKNNLIVSARVFNLNDTTKKIVPGNANDSTLEKGDNFPWSFGWQKLWDHGSEGTLFFIGDETSLEFNLLFPDIPYKDIITAVDIRLFNTNGTIFAYASHHSKFAFKMSCIGFGDDYWTFEVSDQIHNYFIGSAIKDRKNWSMINLDDKGSFDCLFWYTSKGVISFKSYMTLSQVHVDNAALNYEDQRWPLHGHGSCVKTSHAHLSGENACIMPWLSFSTPTIKIDNLHLGVGHAKIENLDEFCYQEGSRIENFRCEHQAVLKKKFGDDFIRHYRFSYLIYFYITTIENGKPTDFFISDFLLPIDLSTKSQFKYKFSLAFATGIYHNEDTDKIVVSTGLGDFYPALLEFDANEIIDSCYHNVQKLNLKDVHYKLLVIDDAGVRVRDPSHIDRQ